MPKRRRKQEQFHVEVISKAKVNEEGEWEYFVKWANYPHSDDTWEPAENVASCSRLLKSFWSHIGMDNEDYYPGYEVEADPQWIEEETAFFWQNFGTSMKRGRPPKTTSKQPRTVTGKAIKHKSKGKAVAQKPSTSDDEFMASSSDEDEVPLSATTKVHAKNKRSATVSSESSGSEDSEQPLRKVRRVASAEKVSATKKGKEPMRSRILKKKSTAVISDGRTSSPPTTSKTSRQAAETLSDAGSLFSEQSSSSPEPPSGPRKSTDAAKASSSKVVPKLSISTKSTGEKGPVSGEPTSAGGPLKSALPSHREREKNPRVQVMPLELKDKTGSGLMTTKQKIAQRAGFVAPKQPSGASTTDGGLFPKKSLANLTFKKNKTSTNPTEVAPAQNQAPDAFFHDQEMVHSPMSTTGGWNWGDEPAAASPNGPGPSRTQSWKAPEAPAPAQRVSFTSLPRTSLPGPSNSVDNMQDAEQFLSQIMPQQLAAPMVEPHPDQDTVAPPRPPTTIAKKVPPIKMAKKWKWTGELYVETGPEKTERFCNVCLSEPTDPRPLGLRFSLCLSTENTTLRLKKFHDLSDIYLILRSCAPVQQWCKFSRQDEADAATVATLGAWMSRKRRFTYSYAYLDDDSVGLIIVFPSAIKEICELFQVPTHLREQSAMLAALLPWKLTMGEYRSARWQLSSGRLLLDPKVRELLQAQHKGKKLLHNPLFARGLRIHKLTGELIAFLAKSPRDYCIWHAPADGTSSKPGFDTLSLVAILNEYKAKNVGYKTDVRIVFVHVGALPTFYKLEALGMRRCKRPELRIYSYGTHATVPPERWGIKEIFPVGGVVTFMPGAIMDDPFGTSKLITKVNEHPLWVCYIHPLALAALVKLDYPAHDPSTLLDSPAFIYSGLMDLINDGAISLLYSPPRKRAPHLHPDYLDQMIDPAMDWVEWNMSILDLQPKEILAECFKMLQKRFPNVPEKDLLLVVEKEVLADMLEIQLQPEIMDNYRRILAIIEPRKDAPAELDGVEITTAAKFDFKDDFLSAR